MLQGEQPSLTLGLGGSVCVYSVRVCVYSMRVCSCVQVLEMPHSWMCVYSCGSHVASSHVCVCVRACLCWLCARAPGANNKTGSARLGSAVHAKKENITIMAPYIIGPTTW